MVLTHSTRGTAAIVGTVPLPVKQLADSRPAGMNPDISVPTCHPRATRNLRATRAFQAPPPDAKNPLMTHPTLKVKAGQPEG